MNFLDFLTPVEQPLLDYIGQLPKHTIGRNISIHKGNNSPTIKQGDIVIFSISEERSLLEDVPVTDFIAVRRLFYSMFLGIWDVSIIDLGSIQKGNTFNDSEVAIREVTLGISNIGAIPLVLGGSQDLLYGFYTALKEKCQKIKIASVDSRLDLGSKEVFVSEESYVSRLIETGGNDLSFVNIGCQTYYNAQESLDIFTKLYFEVYRLGLFRDNIDFSEHILRNVDIGVIDFFNAIKGSEVLIPEGNSNGFSGVDLCSISRYMGMGSQLSGFYLSNCTTQKIASNLIAQVIWYFIEGYNEKDKEVPSIIDEDHFEIYRVSVEGLDLIFIRSKVTERWWFCPQKTKGKELYIPCLKKDYEKSVDNDVSNRILNYL